MRGNAKAAKFPPPAINPEDHLGLVRMCVLRIRPSAVEQSDHAIEISDLFQIGVVALMKAVEDFDHDRGVEFSTYAVPVIHGAMLTAMRKAFKDRKRRDKAKISDIVGQYTLGASYLPPKL